MRLTGRNIHSAVTIGLGSLALAAATLGVSVGGAGCSDSKVSTTGTGGKGGSSGGSSGGSAGGSSGGSAGGSSGGSAGGTSGGNDGGAGSDGGDAGGTACGAPQTVTAPATITADTTWSHCNTYVLPADTRVAVRAPAVLTIEPGTTIQGSSKSSLVIARGAKLMAVGTAAAPIVFTSVKAAGSRAPGDWGGVIIMGKAPINTNANSTPASTEAVFEAFGATEEDGKFGGTDANDSSGTLKYVRIEFGGVAYMPDREWNNITFCGVGAGTTVDYLQSHKGADDSVEFFGGTVNVKHLVLTQNEDDGFDTDNGWQGKSQFVIIQHVAPKGTDASNGYESDNHGTAASYTAVPRTLPTSYNVTLIGRKDYTAAGSFGALFRRGTGGKYYNHIITKFSSGVVEVRDQATADQITAGNLFVKNSIFFDNLGMDGNWPKPQATGDIDEKTIFTDTTWMNRDAIDPMLGDPTSVTAPNFKPATGSPALTGGAAPPSDGFFDPAATFVGAVGTDDWTAGWTAYPQN